MGIALLHSIAPVQEGFVTTGHGQNVFVGLSNEDRRCIWPQAQGKMTADLTPHSYGRQGFEPESLICYTSPLPFRFLFFISSVTLDLFSLPLLSWLWKMFQTQPHWSCMCTLPCSGCSDQKGGGCWRIQNITRKRGLVAFVHEARQWRKASHPSPRRQVLLSPPHLLLQPAKHLACSWELPCAITPITSSALLCTDLMGLDNKIIVLMWKILRLTWLQNTTFSTVD